MRRLTVIGYWLTVIGYWLTVIVCGRYAQNLSKILLKIFNSENLKKIEKDEKARFRAFSLSHAVHVSPEGQSSEVAGARLSMAR